MRTLYFCSILLVLASCKKPEPVNYHYDYFGMELGRYVIYNVKEINHISQFQKDTNEYQLKTVWGEIYIDNEGKEGRVFRRYVRPNSGVSWVLSDTWYGGIYGIRGELVEENQRKVKLVFAPTVSKEWDVNAYNTLEPDECYYRDIHEGYSIGGMDFDSTLMVDIEDSGEPGVIQYLRHYEYYAKGIGLIEKVDRKLFYNFGDTNPIEGSSETFYTYVESGIE